MKEFNRANKRNLQIYQYFVMLIGCVILIALTSSFFSASEDRSRFFIHGLFACVILFILTIYPKRESEKAKGLLIFSTACYIYLIFILYPEISSTTFTLIAIIPSIAILIFSRKLFLFLIICNSIAGPLLFLGLAYSPYNQQYLFLGNGIILIGHLINFAVSQLIMGFIFVLTAKRMERLQQYYQEVQRSERLNSVGYLSAVMAHEVKNPLTVVRGFLELFQEKSSFSREEKKYLKQMIHELDQTQAILHDFLSLAKSHDGKLEKINVKTQIYSMIELLSAYASLNKIELKALLVNDLYIKANTTEIKQVLVNLIKNSVEAMEDGGIVTIEAKKQNNFVVIDVTDTGIGMTPQEVKNLGTPFYSLKEKGTGVGLTVCYNIIEKYNGSVKVNSVKGEGTTFTISIPSYH